MSHWKALQCSVLQEIRELFLRKFHVFFPFILLFILALLPLVLDARFVRPLLRLLWKPLDLCLGERRQIFIYFLLQILDYLTEALPCCPSLYSLYLVLEILVNVVGLLSDMILVQADFLVDFLVSLEEVPENFLALVLFEVLDFIQLIRDVLVVVPLGLGLLLLLEQFLHLDFGLLFEFLQIDALVGLNQVIDFLEIQLDSFVGAEGLVSAVFPPDFQVFLLVLDQILGRFHSLDQVLDAVHHLRVALFEGF